MEHFESFASTDNERSEEFEEKHLNHENLKSAEFKMDETTEMERAGRHAEQVESSFTRDMESTKKNDVEDKDGNERGRFRDLPETEFKEYQERVAPIYENNRQIAGKIPDFDFYKEHNSRHIELTCDKTQQVCEVIKETMKADDYAGCYTPDIDSRTVRIAALYHDTGMDHNVTPETFEEEKSRCKTADFEKSFRSEHSLQSAIHVLRDREFIEKHGDNADNIAMLCYLHSKSTSGVVNLCSGSQLKNAVESLTAAVNEFNKNHSDERISFSDSFLKPRESDSEGKSKEYGIGECGRFRTEAWCLRMGDSNAHDSKSRISQNGKPLDFDITESWNNGGEKFTDTLKEITKYGAHNILDYSNAREKCIKEEVQYADVRIAGQKLDDENDRNGVQRMFAVGEGNFKSLDVVNENGVPTERIVLENANAFPLSTQQCIEERAKEMQTARLDAVDPYGSDKGHLSQENLNAACPVINCGMLIELGDADENVVESYKVFAESIANDREIPVTIRYNGGEVYEAC